MSLRCVQLGEVAEVLSGFAFKSSFFNDKEGLPLIRIRDVLKGESDTYYSGPYSESFIVDNGDILVGMDGAFNTSKWRGGRALLNQRVCKVSAKPDLLDEGYLFHFLSPVLKKIEDATPFVTVKHLSSGDLLSETIPLPPLPEQRRIAAILDKADALRAKRREALAQLDSLTQSIFIEMFGGPVTNPKGLPVKQLKSLGKVKTGGTPRSGIDGMFGGAIPFVTPGDLGSNRSAKRTVTEDGAAEAAVVTEGSALICCIGATIGKMDKARERSAFNQQINAVEWGTDVDSDYGIECLRFFRANIAMWGASTTLPILKKSSFEKIEIPVAPIVQQREFAAICASVARSRDLYEKALDISGNLFASLQHRAFRGEL